MIDHSVNKFFETLFWIGAFLVMISLFQPRWFLATITVGIALMVMATVREGFRLMKAKTFTGVIQKNEPKLIHRFVLLIVVICVFVYLLFRQTLVLSPLKQFYEMTRAPTFMTWWVFVLVGIIIGLLILFFISFIIRIKETGIEIKIQQGGIFTSFWKEVFTSIFKKSGKVEKEEKIEAYIKQKLEEGYTEKKIIEAARKSGWDEKLIKSLLEEEKIEMEKKKAPVEKKIIAEIKPGILSRITWEEKSFWGKILTPLQKRLEQKRIKQLKEQQVRIEELKKKKLGEIKEKAKKEKIVIETEIKHPTLPRIFIALFILAITVILILHRKGKFSIENPISAAILGLIFGLFALYIFKNVYKARQEHKVKEEKKEKALKKIKQEVIARASKYETDVDKFYTLINEVESLTLTEAADVFGVSKEQVEEWGKILESHGMIEIEYPAMGELRLCKKKLKTTE